MATAKVLDDTITLDAVKHAITVLSQSSNAQDLCRRIAHAEFMDGFCQGVAVYLLDQRSYLVEVAAYGRSFDFGTTEISAWDDSLLARAIRSRKIVVDTEAESTLFALPIELAGVTTGAFLFTLSAKVPSPIFTKETTSMLSSLGGLFMDNKGLSLRPTPASGGLTPQDEVLPVQELTTRQVQIIHYMADGLTNAEIAKLVLLSESTVRQETIRIFRILKCHTRSEAIVKARASGIIARVPKFNAIAPPPREIDLTGNAPLARRLGEHF
jgi:DNA-binding CsgD family transcriptional regulator